VTSETKVYEAEVKTYYDDPATGQRMRGWVLMPVWKARQRRDADVRCKECHAPVKLMKAGPNNLPAAHAEHFKRFAGCSLSDIFSGTRYPSPDAIE
jgi:hypothetical protein